MKAKISLLLVILPVILCVVLTSCSSSDNAAEETGITPEEEEQMAQSGSVIVETVEDASRADHVFSALMGEEVPPRKAFITAQAKNVVNLDV